MTLFKNQSTFSSSLPEHREKKNLGIQGLRGVLSFSLYIYHVANSQLPTIGGNAIADAINFFMLSLTHGVELFFGISGIVIVGAFLRSSSSLLFLKNRAIRIFPVLWPAVLIIFLMSPIAGRPFDFSGPWQMGATLIANLLAMPPLLPVHLIHPAAWSLSYEGAFYLLCVVVGTFGGRWRTLRLGVALCLTIFLVGSHLRSVLFLSGILITVVGIRMEKWRPLFDFPFLMMLAALLLWHTEFVLLGHGTNEVNVWDLVQSPPAALCFILAVLCGSIGLGGVFLGRGKFSAILRSRPLQWLGEISFSLYLWQTIAMAVIKKLMYVLGLVDYLGVWSQLGFFLLALPLTLVLSYFSYQYLEVRFPRFIKRIGERQLGRSGIAEEAN